jgi:uncharacterized membrane protein (TIGR02234 family)
MKSPRTRAIVSIGIALAVVLIAWSQVWFTLTTGSEAIEIRGPQASGAILALALACLAVTAAIALAGRRLRVVLAIVLVLAGAGIAVVSVWLISSPSGIFGAVISQESGLTGVEALDSIEQAGFTAWPFVAAIGGAAAALFGFVIATRSRDWTATGRRYEQGARRAGDTAVDQWDALSEGEDPTVSDR